MKGDIVVKETRKDVKTSDDVLTPKELHDVFIILKGHLLIISILSKINKIHVLLKLMHKNSI